jgi:hypothetical protein
LLFFSKQKSQEAILALRQKYILKLPSEKPQCPLFLGSCCYFIICVFIKTLLFLFLKQKVAGNLFDVLELGAFYLSLLWLTSECIVMLMKNRREILPGLVQRDWVTR